jgi:hypothetical protein
VPVLRPLRRLDGLLRDDKADDLTPAVEAA